MIALVGEAGVGKSELTDDGRRQSRCVLRADHVASCIAVGDEWFGPIVQVGLQGDDLPLMTLAVVRGRTLSGLTSANHAEAITFPLRRSGAKRRLQAPEIYNLDQVLAEFMGGGGHPKDEHQRRTR